MVMNPMAQSVKNHLKQIQNNNYHTPPSTPPEKTKGWKSEESKKMNDESDLPKGSTCQLSRGVTILWINMFFVHIIV